MVGHTSVGPDAQVEVLDEPAYVDKLDPFFLEFGIGWIVGKGTKAIGATRNNRFGAGLKDAFDILSRQVSVYVIAQVFQYPAATDLVDQRVFHPQGGLGGREWIGLHPPPYKNRHIR